jgi:hypothetical protein
MLPSLHDDFLVAYEVNCETRQIKLYAKRDPRIPGSEEHPTRVIVFSGVEGYQFENDNFSNIIFSLEAAPVETLLSRFASRLAESSRMAGAPGPWADDLLSASKILTEKGVQGFILSSSWGLSGWILAKEVSTI